MDCLPDHILETVLVRLPLLDRFRFRILARQFHRFLQPLLERMHLEEMELVLQFRQRKLPPLDYFGALALLIENCGHSVSELKIVFRNFGAGKDKIVRSIIRHCPNLTKLEFECINFWGTTPVAFPVDGLMQLLNLKQVGARLGLPGPAQSTDASRAMILDRIRQLDNVSWLQFNCTSGWVETFTQSGTAPVHCIKGLIVGKEFGSVGFDKFPGLECLDARLYFAPAALVPSMPKSLRKLELDVYHDVTFTPDDLENFAAMTHIDEFKIDCHNKGGGFPNFRFLRYFGQLERLAIWKSPNFDSTAFEYISPKAPLSHVELLHCPAVCEDVFRCMANRKYRLQCLSVEKLEPEPEDENYVPTCSREFGKLLALNASSLTSLVPYSGGVDDAFFARLPDQLILGLSVLSLKWNDLNVTPVGLRHMLQRRKQLLSSADGAGMKAIGLMLLLVMEPILSEMEEDKQLVEAAMVWVQIIP